MAVRAPTVKREWGQKTSTVHSHPQPRLRHSHNPTSPAIHDFLAGGKGDSRLWQGKVGAIHNLDPSIHNLVHEIWQGKGLNGDLWTEIAILTVRLLIQLSTTPTSRRPTASSTSPNKYGCNQPSLAAGLPLNHSYFSHSRCHCSELRPLNLSASDPTAQLLVRTESYVCSPHISNCRLLSHNALSIYPRTKWRTG